MLSNAPRPAARQTRLRNLFRSLNYLGWHDRRSDSWRFRRYVALEPINPIRTDNRFAVITAADSEPERGALELSMTLTTRLGTRILKTPAPVREEELADVLRRWEAEAVRALKGLHPAGALN